MLGINYEAFRSSAVFFIFTLDFSKKKQYICNVKQKRLGRRVRGD
jgi:hypothetical protein